MSAPSHHGLTVRHRLLVPLALLAMLALVGWHVPSAYSICNPADPDCPFPPPPPPPTNKDFYCAYPVLLDMGITDAHESDLNDPEAYMFFSSAGAAKTGSYADYLGTGLSTPAGAPPQTQYDYDNDAWASNFKGILPITGESSRTQWEWLDSAWYPQVSSWGAGGTPYKYGKGCKSVSVGSRRPDLGYRSEDVYEDDECIWGVCNPDDYVGGFRIYRHWCETDVWSKGYATGWTNEYSADVWDDIYRVRYKLWCYACANTTSCATGVGPDRGPGY